MFVAVICVIAGLAVALPFALKYASTGGIDKIINDKVEQFTINDGIFYSEQKYEGEPENIAIKDLYVKIDPDSDYDENNFPDIDKEMLFFGIYRDKMIIKCADVKSVVENYNLESMGIKDKQSLVWSVKVLQLLAVGMLIFYYVTFCALEILIMWQIVKMICTFLEKKISQEELFKICAYARTMPFLLFSLLIMAGGFSGGLSRYISMRYPIYIAVYSVYIFIAVKNYEVKKNDDIKNDDDDENNGKADEEEFDDKSIICDLDNFDSSKFE
jgi:hypothetical protein